MERMSNNARVMYRMMLTKAPTLDELERGSWTPSERIKPTFTQKKAMVRLAKAWVRATEGGQ